MFSFLLSSKAVLPKGLTQAFQESEGVCPTKSTGPACRATAVPAPSASKSSTVDGALQFRSPLGTVVRVGAGAEWVHAKSRGAAEQRPWREALLTNHWYASEVTAQPWEGGSPSQGLTAPTLQGLLGWWGQGCHGAALRRRGSLVEQKGRVLRGRQSRLCYLVAVWPRTKSLTSLTLRFFIYNTEIATLILPGLLWGLNEIIHLTGQQHSLSDKVT